jgi:aminoglycoside phosphotransferase family enzyme/adenylate kinase family enzyme
MELSSRLPLIRRKAVMDAGAVLDARSHGRSLSRNHHMSFQSETHVVSDQGEVLAFLSDPTTYRLSEPVQRIDTHGAVVFLAGSDVYKVKRAVRFPFMDYSTLEKRRAACEAEIEINRPGAPSIYLDTTPITRSEGTLALGGEGPVVEWAVHMRRFDERQTLDHLAASGDLTPPLLAKLVRAILASHARSPRRDGAAATASLRSYVRQNEDAFRELPELFASERVARLMHASRALLDQIERLLITRGAAGYVRRCHGDLHLRNLVLLDGEPTLFDAVEFDDAVATGDVLYDLAFLLMDLWERGLREAANTVLNRYLWESDEAHLSGLAALPLFLSIRAAIRAKVTAAGLPHFGSSERDQAASDAIRYFDNAVEFLEPAAARVIAVGGLSGSGKSTLASMLAPSLGRAPGAVHLRSDIERKRRFGVPETEPLPADAYVPEVTQSIYAELRRKAKLATAAGHTVIVDGVHAREEERRGIEEVARGLSLPFVGLWLDAPLRVLVDRVDHRSDDASDADATVVTSQAAYDLGQVNWHRLDASGGREALANAALAKLSQPGCLP